MDDQNQNSQPLSVSGMPAIPDKPEDITPLPSPATAPVAPLTDLPVPPAVPQPVEPVMPPTPMPEMPIVPEVSTPTIPFPVEPTYGTSIPEPTSSVSSEPPMPKMKPKSKVWPVVGGVVALLLVVGVAGAAYYVSNQLSTRRAVAPNAPTSKPAAAELCVSGTVCRENCNEDEEGNGQVCSVNGVDGSCCKPTGSGGGGGGGTGACTADGTWHSCSYVSNVGSTGPVESSCDTSNWANDSCTSYTYKCGIYCLNSSCGGAACYDENPTSATCIEYVYIPNPTSEQENQIICNPNRGDIIRSVSFSKAGAIRIHIEGAAGGTTVRLKNGGADIAMVKVDEKNFDATVQAGTYGIIVRLGNETADSLGYIKPSGSGICQRYGEPRDISSRMTMTALSSFGIASTDGVDVPVQCWADTLQGADTDQRGQLDANYDFNDFDIEIGYKAAACVPSGVVTCNPDCPTTCGLPASTISTCTNSCGAATTKSCPATAACPVISTLPNCKNISGPDTITLGQSANYTATFVKSESGGLTDGEIFFSNVVSEVDQKDIKMTTPPSKAPVSDNGTVTGTFIPSAVGQYILRCRAWNDGIAECRPPATVATAPTNPLISSCVGPGYEKKVTVVAPDAVGACMLINVYKKVNGVYGTTPLTASELQDLKIGDVLKFSLNSNVDNLLGRFRVTVSNTAGQWLAGTIDATNKKLVSYSDYAVSSAGTYKFEAQVSTRP